MRASTMLAGLTAALCNALLHGASMDYATHGDQRLGALLAEALERNAGVRAAAWEAAAAGQRIPLATALPEPTVQVTGFARSPETRLGAQSAGVSVTQKLPWFGKRADQGQVATMHAARLQALADAQRAEVVRQVKIAYFELAYLDHATANAFEAEHLVQHYESLVRTRYSQGLGSQQAVVRLQARITDHRARRQTLVRQRVAAESALNALRDQPAQAAIGPVELGTRPAAVVDDDRLRAIGRVSRPEARAAQLAVESSEVGVRLARRRQWPDVVVGAVWGRIDHFEAMTGSSGAAVRPAGSGKDTLGFTVAVNVPLDRAGYDARVQEALARHAAALASHRSVLADLEQAIRTAGFALTTIEAQATLAATAQLPQAEQALRASEEAYAAGTGDIVDLLASEQALLDVRLALARLEADYRQTLADVERAIGVPFPPAVQPRSTAPRR